MLLRTSVVVLLLTHILQASGHTCFPQTVNSRSPQHLYVLNALHDKLLLLSFNRLGVDGTPPSDMIVMPKQKTKSFVFGEGRSMDVSNKSYVAQRTSVHSPPSLYFLPVAPLSGAGTLLFNPEFTISLTFSTVPEVKDSRSRAENFVSRSNSGKGRVVVVGEGLRPVLWVATDGSLEREVLHHCTVRCVVTSCKQRD